ncbi:HAD family hydrolase [Aestuariivivens sediminicola]|uniref:HAD family hydrolase n=1 Tax=Aestuariivivens sediminicola TaxID=2913560 RepID=UPI001F5A253A|nr:HAD family phosphatase [Aestuariivivens sediminicola]
MLKGVIFDMDGVIVDSEPIHRKAYQHLFEELSIEVSDALYESFTGRATLSICQTLCNHFHLKENPETLVALKRKYYNYLFDNDERFQLIDGVLDLIKDYHTNGLTLVLGSSASMPNIERIFERFNLNTYFKTKFSGADLKASKPHPEIFLKALQSTGFNIEECMVIEDSTNGMEAARAANIFCVGYKSKHSKNQDYSKADIVISDFKSIYYSRIHPLFECTT